MAIVGPPTGVAIKRANGTFTCSWKNRSNESNITYHILSARPQYRIFNKKVTNLSEKRWQPRSLWVTSDSQSFNTNNYYPHNGNKLQYVSWILKYSYYLDTNSTKKSSGMYWSNPEQKTFYISTPKAPSISAKLDNSFTTTFTWSVATSDTDQYWFTRVQWESILLKDSNLSAAKDISKYFNKNQLGWQTNTGNKSGSKQISENTTMTGWLTNASYTRWFRVRSQGPAGDSGWVYSKHVYAMPKQSTQGASTAVKNGQNGTDITVKWSNVIVNSYPIDKFTVQYLIDTPAENLGPKPGASWSNANGGSAKPVAANNTYSFKSDQQIQEDQCLWTRVNETHDYSETEGVPKRLMKGDLKKPSNLAAVVNTESYTADISAKNKSGVPGSFLVVRFYHKVVAPSGLNIAIMPNGTESLISVELPGWTSSQGSPYFAVYATTGSYTYVRRTTGGRSYNLYTITGSDRMQSAEFRDDASIMTNPVSPEYVNLSSFARVPGTLTVEWPWSWADSTFAELSWSDHDDAWNSTNAPSTYTVMRSGKAATGSWNISGLTPGVEYYVKVRLGTESSDGSIYSNYTAIQSLVVSSIPYTPSPVLSESLVLPDGSVTVAWGYYSDDGSYQASAQVAIKVDNTYPYIVGRANELHHVAINASDILEIAGMKSGSVQLAVRVTSSAGLMSDWSEPVDLMIVEPLTVTIDETSLVEKTETIGEEDPVTRTYNALTAMPLTLTVTGAGDGGSTVVAIERTDAYFIERPDESHFSGSEGESILSYANEGDGEIVITNEMLHGSLNDGARYRLIVTAINNLGQRASETIDFEVDWTHKSIVPEATVEIDNDAGTATLSPALVAGAPEGDVCDIYRLSLDKPDLVVSDAVFGQNYTDPYPTIGENGGYRFVYRTFNNDYITQDKTLGWTDIEGGVSTLDHIIDFESDQVRIPYNVDLSSNWTKDFKETKYLGGSVQGDWNPAVSRTGTINAEVVIFNDQETIAAMRRLAVYAGVCRVRTRDGSNYAANVEVSESRGYEPSDLTAHFSLTIVRVDQESAAGYKLENEEEEVNGMG